MGSLDGKIALVTGASRGIGRAIALELGREGAKVALNYRSSEAEARSAAQEILVARSAAPGAKAADAQGRTLADEVSSRVGAMTIAQPGSPEAEDSVMFAQADISSSTEARAMVRRVLDRWGRLDILVNNAGITRDRTLRKLSDEDWLSVINNNLNSVYYVTSAAIPFMIEQGYGRIVNVTSMIAQAGNIGQANYGASKGGMMAFTKCAAMELARYNITVNGVSPGFTATDMMARVPENIQDQIKAKIPMGRFAQPEDIAKAVRFLVVDGDYITGQQISVNGGLYV